MNMYQYSKNFKNNKNRITTAAFMLIICFCFAGAVYAKDEKNIKLQKEEKKETSSSIAEKIKPEIGARGSFVVPFGTPAPFLGYGYGAALYFDFSPYEYKLFSLRLGVTSEFMYFKHDSSSISATLMLFPEYVHIKFSVLFPFGLMLYPKLGCGASMALLKKKEYGIINTKNASIDLTAVGGFGIGYNPPTVKNLVVFIEADYKMLFESVNGQFVSASLGVAYRF
jgi:hypothetical protein